MFGVAFCSIRGGDGYVVPRVFRAADSRVGLYAPACELDHADGPRACTIGHTKGVGVTVVAAQEQELTPRSGLLYAVTLYAKCVQREAQ